MKKAKVDKKTANLKDKVRKHEKKEDTLYKKLQKENKKFEKELK